VLVHKGMWAPYHVIRGCPVIHDIMLDYSYWLEDYLSISQIPSVTASLRNLGLHVVPT
jgi:hypothetical protein